MLKRSERKSDIALREHFGKNTLRLLISVITLSLFSADLSVVQAAEPNVNQSVRSPYLTAGSGSFNMDGSRPPGGFQGSILKNIYGHCMSININGPILRKGQAIVAGDCTKESFVWKSSWTPDAFYLEVKNSPGLCAIAASGINGYDLKVLPCESGYGLWTKLTQMSGAIKLWNTPFCLDVEGGRRTAGVPLQIWECKLVNSIPIEAQTWSMIEGGSANPPVGTVAPPSGAAPPEQPYLFIIQSGQQLSASWFPSSGATRYEVELHRVKAIREFGPRTATYWDTQKFGTSSTSLSIKLDRYNYQSHTTQRVGLRACNTVCSTWHYVDYDKFRPNRTEQKAIFEMLADKFPLSFWSKIDAYKPLYFPYSILENDLCSWVPESKRGRFDFTLACTYHDWLYRNAKRLEREFGFDTWNRNRRKSYDDSFLAMMSEWCDQYQKKKSCYALAFTYYQGVRLGGWK
jgi:hypothetical protein